MIYTSLYNNFGNIIDKYTNSSNISGRITRNIIENGKSNFSEVECVIRCNVSTEHLTSVFNNTEEEFNEKVIDENSINEIHNHCLK